MDITQFSNVIDNPNASEADKSNAIFDLIRYASFRVPENDKQGMSTIGELMVAQVPQMTDPARQAMVDWLYDPRHRKVFKLDLEERAKATVIAYKKTPTIW